MSGTTHPDAVLAEPIVPLATVTTPVHADALAQGLVAGGMPIVEVTLRHDYGLSAIEKLAGRGDLLVGAGTVLTTTQAQQVIDAGAQFIVTPGLDPEVVAAAQAAGIPVIPGVFTATEVMVARRLGVDHVKLFPASSVDTFAMLDAYADVFPGTAFMPSAGMKLDNIGRYLSHRAVFAISGSWIAAAAREGVEAVSAAAQAARRVADRVRTVT